LVDGQGHVLAATSEPGELLGATASLDTVRRQVAAVAAARIAKVHPDRPDVAAPDEALAARARHPLTLLVPGSLSTSVLSACATQAVTDALAATSGRIAYVCNLRPQVPETEGYCLADHLEAVRRHGIEPHHVVADPAHLPDGPPVEGVTHAELASTR